MRRLLAAVTCLFVIAAAASVRVGADPRQILVPALSRALAAVHAGRLPDAVREYTRVVDADPGNAAAHIGLVQALLKLNRVADAARAVARACACKPNHPQLQTASGDVSFRQGDFPAASRSYRAALALAPTCARAHWGLGRIALTERRNRSAAAHFLAAYRLAPDDPDVVLDWAATRQTRAEWVAAAERYLAIAGGEDGQALEGVRARLSMMQALGERATFVVADPRRTYTLDLHEALGPEGPLRAYRLVVLLNGRKLRLTVDTGVSGILLNRSAADRCHLVPVANALPVKGVGDEGAHKSRLAIAETLRAGDLEMTDCEVKVDSGRGVEDGDGLIGTDVFSRFLVTLDFPGRKLVLRPLEKDERSIAEDFWGVERQPRAGFTPVRVFGHLLLADTRIDDVSGFLFAVDSGSPTELLSTAAAKRIGRLHVTDAVVRGVSGRVLDTLTTGRVTLSVGDLSRPGPLLAVNLDDQNSREGTEISGILGLDALQQFAVTIDYTNGLIRLDRGGR